MADRFNLKNAPRDHGRLNDLSDAVLFRLFIQSGVLLGLSEHDSNMKESSFLKASHEDKVVFVHEAIREYDRKNAGGSVIDFVEQGIDPYASPNPSKTPL
jgi:hypothetical protein